MLQNFLPALACVTISFIIAGFDLKATLQFEREAIANGASWRIVAGHFAHLNIQHLLLNVAALAIIWELFYRSVKPWRSSLEVFLLALFVSAGLFFLMPGLEWYVGLSGILHGLFARGALASWQEKPLWATCLIAGLIVKLGWEQWAGALTVSALAGAPVVVNAHLYGAIGGAMLVLEELIRKRRNNHVVGKTKRSR